MTWEGLGKSSPSTGEFDGQEHGEAQGSWVTRWGDRDIMYCKLRVPVAMHTYMGPKQGPKINRCSTYMDALGNKRASPCQYPLCRNPSWDQVESLLSLKRP